MEEKTINSMMISLILVISLVLILYFQVISAKKSILEKFKLGCLLYIILMAISIVIVLIATWIKSFF